MSHIIGAHCLIEGTQNGHNSIMGGGSYHFMTNSEYCTITGGTRSIVRDATYSSCVGSENVVQGVGNFVSGFQNECDSNYSVVEGRENKSERDYTVTRGYQANSVIAGADCFGHKGIGQVSRITLEKTTTDGVKTTMRAINNETSLDVLSNAIVRVSGKVTATDGTDYATFNLEALMDTTNGASSLISEDTNTVYASAGASSWAVVAQQSNDSFLVRPTGEAGKTIKWFATVDVQELY